VLVLELVVEVDELWEYLDSLSIEFDDCFRKKELSIQTRLSCYPTRHFSTDSTPATPLEWAKTSRHVQIDELDNEILNALTCNPGLMKRDIARSLGIPHSTLDYRVKRLEKNEAIKGFGYEVNHEKLGLQGYRLLLTSKGPDQKLRRGLADYCATTREAGLMIECIGSFDYTILVRVWNAREAFAMGQDIQNRFGSRLSAVRLIPMFKVLGGHPYPYESWKERSLAA